MTELAIQEDRNLSTATDRGVPLAGDTASIICVRSANATIGTVWSSTGSDTLSTCPRTRPMRWRIAHWL